MTYTLFVPLGTQIVTRVEPPATANRDSVPAGAVGVIVKAPTDQTHAYRVQLVNGVEVSLKRSEFSIRKQHQQAEYERVNAYQIRTRRSMV